MSILSKIFGGGNQKKSSSNSKLNQKSSKKSYSWQKEISYGTGKQNKSSTPHLDRARKQTSASRYYAQKAHNDPVGYMNKFLNDRRNENGTLYRSGYQQWAHENPKGYMENFLTNARANKSNYLSKDEWKQQNRIQHIEKRGLLSRIFGTMGYNGIVEGLYNATDDDASTTFGQGLVEGFKNMNPLENDVSGYNTFSDVLRNMGWEDKPNGKPNVLRGVVGFAGDVFLDPMTYINPFSSAGKVAKGTGITLDMAKDMKALSKAASISDDINKATKLNTAGGKLNRVLSLDEVTKYVREKNPHLSEPEILQKSEKLHNSYAKKVQGLRDADEGADFGIGLSGIPFSSKIKVGDKTLDKFQATFIKSSDLRKFGDATIAPYYNSMMKKLRAGRIASAVSKNNQMLRTAEKNNVFDSFKEFYLRDMMRGYDKAAKNVQDLNTADELRNLFKDATDDDFLRWIKDHEDGVHEAKIRYDEVRLKADEEFIKQSNLKEADRKAALETINAQKKQLEEFRAKADSLYNHLNSEEAQWNYRYANNTLETTASKYQQLLQDWIDKEALDKEITKAADDVEREASSIADNVNSLNSSIEKANQKIDETKGFTGTTFESTVSEADSLRYAGINDEINSAKAEFNNATRIDTIRYLSPEDRELFIANDVARRGVDKYDWTKFFTKHYTNRWGQRRSREIGSTVVNGEPYIRIADKRPFIEQVQRMYPDLSINVNGVTDNMFMDMYTDLLVGDYEEFYKDLNYLTSRESRILGNASETGATEEYIKYANDRIKEIDDEIAKEIADAKAKKREPDNALISDLKKEKSTLNYRLKTPANLLEVDDIRAKGKGYDRLSDEARNVRNENANNSVVDAEREMEKYGYSYGDRQAYEEIYARNNELLDEFADYSYELYGTTPKYLTGSQLYEYFDEVELLQKYAVNGEVDWNGILETFRNGVKGRDYSRIRKGILDAIEKSQISDKEREAIIFSGRNINTIAYNRIISNLMRDLGQYGIKIEDASGLAVGRLDPYQLANIVWNGTNNNIAMMRENLLKSGYTPTVFKRDFLALSHDERMDVLRAYNSNYFDEYGNAFKDVWANTMARIDGVTINSNLSRFNDYELDVIKRAVRKSWTKKVANYPEDKIDKLNEIAQQLWRDNQRNIKIRNMSAKDDALQTVTNEVNSFKTNKLLDEVHDVEFEEKLNKFAEVKDMSPFDREIDFCDMISGSLEYNKWMAENCRLLGDNGAIKADLLDNFEDTEEAIQKYKKSLLAHVKDESVTRKELEEMHNVLLDLDNQREKILADASNRGIEFYIPGEFVELQKIKSKEVFELRDKLSDRINWYDEYVSAIESGSIVDDVKILGDDIVDDFTRETDDLASGSRTYDNDGTMYSATEHYSFDRESELQKLQSRIDDAEAFKAKFESDKAEFIRQRKNARQRAKYWTTKLEKLQQELVNVNVPLEQAKERYRQLVKEASEIPSISQEDIAYLGSRMKQFTKYLNDFEDKTIELNNLRKGVQDIEEQLAASNRELGEIQLRYIESTSDLEIARMLNLNNDFLGRIEDMSKAEWEEVAHTLFADRMEQIASDETKFKLLSAIQGESHMKGRSYVRHELSEAGKTMVGEMRTEAKEGGFNPEWGSRAKFNKRRIFDTIAEGESIMGKGFYVHDPVELFLTRAIKSNELIHSHQINDIIKDLCTPYTGTKSSDHVVASYIDVNSALFKGYNETANSALESGVVFAKSFDEFRSEALKRAGIDEKMFTENYAYFDILPEQFDILKRSFGEKSDVALFNMDNKLFHTVNQFTDMQMKSMQSGFMKVFDGVQRGWKSVNTFINPGFHIQNALSNAFTSFLSIGADAFNPAKIKRTTNILRTKDPKQFIRTVNGNFTYKQIADMIDQFGVVDNTFFNKDVMDSLEGVYRFFPFRLGNKMGTSIEGTQRAHLFISGLEQGMSPEDAAEMVDKFLFDYADLTHFEQTTLKRIIPFYTFMRKNLPLQLEMMIEQPQKYLNFQKAIREVGEMAPEGGYIEENERNPYRQGDIQLPFQINGRYYGIADQMPYSQLERILDPQKLLGQTSPWFKTPIEALANTFLYTGQSITNGDGSFDIVGEGEGSDKFWNSDLVNYIAQQVPYAKMVENGNKKVGKGETAEEADKDKNTRRALYILGQLAGFPVNSIDRMYWYEDYGNWARNYFDTPLPQQIQRNMDERRNN